MSRYRFSSFAIRSKQTDQFVAYSINQRLGHLVVKRECNRPRSDRLAHREITLRIAEPLHIARLKVDRGEIVVAPDPLFAETIENPISVRPVVILREPNDKDEPAQLDAFLDPLKAQPRLVGKARAVRLRHARSGRYDLVHSRELGHAEGTVDITQTVIIPQPNMR